MARSAETTVLNRFFPDDSAEEMREKYGFTRTTRFKRLREIFKLVRKHKLSKGLSPQQLVDMLVDMGPSFIKIGQMLSLRSEILPQSYCDALAQLQAQCDPMPFEQVQMALRDVYGDRFRDIFAEIDPKPLGSASIAQVHRAVLVSGDEVAVKVRRPDVRITMAQDIDVLLSLARRLERFSKDDSLLNPVGIVEELAETTEEETNFLNEAKNLEEFAALNQDTVFVGCPVPYMEYCTEAALVMEYVKGIPIDDLDALKKAGYDLEEIGEKAMDNYATQILDHGFFHADPHPGNIVVRDGKIMYLDLGMMGRLTSRDRLAFGRIVEAVGMKDAAKLRDALIGFATSSDLRRMDHARLTMELDIILGRYTSTDVSEIDVGALLTDVFSVTQQCHVTLPSSVTQVGRGIVTLEGTLAPHLANLNMVKIINGHLSRGRDPKEEAKKLAKEAATSAFAATRGLAAAAEYSGELMRMATRGQLKVNMDMTGSVEPLRKLSRILNRFALCMVIAGLLVGGSLIYSIEGLPWFMGMPVLTFIMYACALIIFIAVLVDIYR